MKKNPSLYQIDLENEGFKELQPHSSYSLKIKEKTIESWIAKKPELLFSDPKSVLIIAQELSGEPLADLLALDSQGNLVIIEIKRDWSERGTVGQILDYASELDTWTYDDFNRRWMKHEHPRGELLDAFREFVENDSFPKKELCKKKRLFILAPHADDKLLRIIDWLNREYEVPIDFVPFQFYKQNEELFLEITKIHVEPIPVRQEFVGDWFFNTDETNSPGAYENILKEGVIAVWGYEDETGSSMLEQPKEYERVFAYINRHGIVAVGRVGKAEVASANSVFGQQKKSEYHRPVKWETIVDVEKGAKANEVSQWGYNLPVRSSLCRIYHTKIGDKIEEELKKRNN